MTLLAAAFGTYRLTRLEGWGHLGSAWQENIVALGLVSASGRNGDPLRSGAVGAA